MSLFLEQYENPPVWLRWFMNDVIRGFTNLKFTAPVGCHYYFDKSNSLWEVSVFISRTEVYGGGKDGKKGPTGLQINVTTIAHAFDFSPSVHWQAEQLSDDDQLGNHMSFEGKARGVSVWLRILKNAPEWTGPGRLVHAHTGQVTDLW